MAERLAARRCRDVSRLHKHAFMLGKFMPPHAGHIYVANVGERLADTMSVLVCTNDQESIPGERRAEWMRDLLPQSRILHMHREIPQEPGDHRDFWPIWREAVREHHREPIDWVLGSESYVFRLAEELEAQPVLIDPQREIFNVSGTAVRTNPAQHWQHIGEPVRAWYRKRICLLGPESVGKSALARRLAEHFHTVHMPEYGRTYDACYRGGKGWAVADFVRLACIHKAMRIALAPQAKHFYFEDTDALQTLVWSRMLGADVGVQVNPEIGPGMDLGLNPGINVKQLLPDFEPADLYLLLDAGVKWHDDGTRYFGDDDTREMFFAECESALRAGGYRYSIITGADWSERENQAHAAIAEVFGMEFLGHPIKHQRRALQTD